MKITFRYLPVLLLFLFSCKKEDPNPDQLPPATQEGKNTFGCYVNGDLWVPQAPGLFERRLTPVFGDWIRIEALRYTKNDGSDSQDLVITFLPDVSNEERTYLVDEENASALFFDRTTGCDYFTENNLEGIITITKYDLEEKILAGTFEFTLDKEDCEALHFTEGRFDIRIP